MTGCLKNFDQYGEPINLTYKGNSKYNTHFGGIISLFVTVVLLLYSVFNLYRVVNFLGTETNTDVVLVDLSAVDEIQPY